VEWGYRSDQQLLVCCWRYAEGRTALIREAPSRKRTVAFVTKK
jgi:hypothetical protein